jgi:hypothetical protein
VFLVSDKFHNAKKKIDKKFRSYISTSYVLATSFHEKPIFLVSSVKKQNLVLKKYIFTRYFFIFSRTPCSFPSTFFKNVFRGQAGPLLIYYASKIKNEF